MHLSIKNYYLNENNIIDFDDDYNSSQTFKITQTSTIYTKPKENTIFIKPSKSISENFFIENNKIGTILFENEKFFFVKESSKNFIATEPNIPWLIYKGNTFPSLKNINRKYVLSEGDVIKLGRIYLKIKHINLKNTENLQTSFDDSIENKTNNNKTRIHYIFSILYIQPLSMLISNISRAFSW